MSFSTDWDIDYYRTDYESEEHWDLRRTFMETHKSDFPEDELVCLAQVFTNVEFLGCKYPEATMRKVALLSQDVAKEFRQSRAGKLKRTFMGASDAAGAKAKARSGSSSNTITKKQPIAFVAAGSSSNSTTDSSPKSDYQQQIKPNLIKHKFDTTNNYSNEEAPHSSQKYQKLDNNFQSYKDFTNLFANNFKDFIIYEPIMRADSTIADDTKSFLILNNSAAKQKIPFVIDYIARKNDPKNPIMCTVNINSLQVAGSIGETKKHARTIATDLALESMRSCCFTIKMMPEKLKTINVEATKLPNVPEVKSSSLEDCKLTENNIGFKMMKMLGWTGGALSEGGITEPINVQLKVNRHGLGISSSASDNNSSINDKQFKGKFYAYLRKYISERDNVYELVFSKDFSKEERAMLHTISRQLNLKSKSKNTPDGDRYLIVSKKIDFIDLANNIMNNGVYSELYDLIYPTKPTYVRN